MRWISRNPIFLFTLLVLFFYVGLVGSELSKYYSIHLGVLAWLFVVTVLFYILYRAVRVFVFEIHQTPFFMKAEVYPRLYTTIIPYIFFILFSLAVSFSILCLISRSLTEVEVGSFAGVTLKKHHGDSLEWFILVTKGYLQSQGLSHIFILEGESLEAIVEKLYVESGGDLQVFQDLLRAKIHGTRLWFYGKHLGLWSPLGLGPWSDLRDHMFFYITWSPGRGFEQRFYMLTIVGRFGRYLLFGYY